MKEALFFAFLCTLIFTLADLIAKIAVREASPYHLVLFDGIFAVIGALAFIHLFGGERLFPPLKSAVLLALHGAVLVFGSVLFYLALSQGKVALVNGIVNAKVLLLIPAGWLFFREDLGLSEVVGIFLVFVGTLLIFLSR